MAFNDRDSWVNFNKPPYITETGKVVIVTSADASKTPILDAEYTRQDEQRWYIPDTAAEKAYLNVKPSARKVEILDALAWHKEVYLKMRHDAKAEVADLKQKLHLMTKARDEARGNNFAPGSSAPSSKASGFNLNSFVMGGMLVAGAVFAAVIGINMFG